MASVATWAAGGENDAFEARMAVAKGILNIGIMEKKMETTKDYRDYIAVIWNVYTQFVEGLLLTIPDRGPDLFERLPSWFKTLFVELQGVYMFMRTNPENKAATDAIWQACESPRLL